MLCPVIPWAASRREGLTVHFGVEGLPLSGCSLLSSVVAAAPPPLLSTLQFTKSPYCPPHAPLPEHHTRPSPSLRPSPRLFLHSPQDSLYHPSSARFHPSIHNFIHPHIYRSSIVTPLSSSTNPIDLTSTLFIDIVVLPTHSSQCLIY